MLTIQLPEELERFIRAEVQSGLFASEAEAIIAAVRLLQSRDRETRDEPGGSADLARRQRENLQRLCASLDALPVAAASDGLTNRDHDRILYGSRQ